MGRYWSKLEHGDTVDIVAPGMRPSAETLKAIPALLASWGLKARISKKLLGPDLICSNSKELRFQNLKNAIMDEDSKMVWCVRGGYGSLQFLDQLDRLKPQKTKIFMGLSDITSLHTHFIQKWGWSTIHGCNIDRLALQKTTQKENNRIKDVLFGKIKSLNYKLKALNPAAQSRKRISSSVVGGNLITLQSGFGTKHQIKTQNKILFFEDIGERAYRIDRVFNHMEQLSLFKGVEAVIFGQFTGSREPDGKDLVPSLLKEFALNQKFPVFSGLAVGHGENQHPLPLGTKAQIQSGSKPQLMIETGCLLS